MLVSWSGTTNTTPLSFISGTPNTKTSEIKFPICLGLRFITARTFLPINVCGL